MIPRRPRSAPELALLATALVTGLPLRWTLRRLWAEQVTESPSATPDSGYRACRRSTAIDLAACVLAGVPAVMMSLFAGRLLLALAGLLSAVAYLAALADGKVPAVWQAELFLLIRRRRRTRFHGFLEQAVGLHVLRPAGPYYRFCDPSVQDYLIGIQQAVVDEREQRRAAKKQQIDTAVAAANGARPWLLGLLSPIAIFRLAMDLGCGAGIGIYAGMVANRPPGDNSVWRTSVLSGLFGPAVVFPAAFVLLTVVVRGTRWSLWRTGRMSSRTRVGAAAALVCVAGLVVWLLGPAVVRHGIAVMAVTLMPAVLVAGVGGWACVMVHRRWQASRHWAARHAADALLIAVTGTAILLLYQRDLVGAQGAAGLLFPVAVWFSIRGWRAMNDADRFAVRAAADIAVSLMLGGSLVLLLVWLANLLHMPAAEVAVLRGVLGRAGAVIDLPWWTWAAVYLVLAGVSLAFAVWPGKLAKIIDWFTRLRVVPSVEVTRRGLAAVHIGLLVIVLIGLAGPAATAPVLRARLAARYTETLTDTLRARGELAAYQAIIREFSLTRQPLLTPLADLVAQIDAISKPSDGQHNATSTELDLARRIGELQAVTLAPRPPGVGLTNQVRYLQEDSGPCDGCAQPEHPRDQPGPDTIDHPEPDIGF